MEFVLVLVGKLRLVHRLVPSHPLRSKIINELFPPDLTKSPPPPPQKRRSNALTAKQEHFVKRLVRFAGSHPDRCESRARKSRTSYCACEIKVRVHANIETVGGAKL